MAAGAARARGVAGSLADRRWLSVRGPDAAAHLQAMLTRDLSDLAPGGARYAALLDDRARYLADCWVLRPAGEWILDAAAGVADRLRERLERFAVAADVEVVALAATHSLFHWEGRAAEGVSRRLDLEGVPVTMAARSHFGERGVTAAVPRSGAARFASALESAAQAEGLFPASGDLLERLRIESGRLEGGRDVTEQDLLAEAGLWGAVSLDKGCFPGQEILQRVARQGSLRRRRAGLRWDGASSYAGAESPTIRDGSGEPVGQATSWVATPETGGGLALAWVRADRDDEGRGWRIVLGDEPHPCRLVEPPFVPLGLGRLAETPRSSPFADEPARGGESPDG